MTRRALGAAAIALACLASGAPAQSPAPTDTVLRAIWREGMAGSQLYPLAQTLLDSIGPRLTGTPAHRAANEWAVRQYRDWGIEARNEQYGTWLGWDRGITHVDLLQPRVRTLEATLLAWSPGTSGPVEGGVVTIPAFSGPADFERWLPQVRGKFVLFSFPMLSCRPEESWQRWALPETLARARQAQAQVAQAWQRRLASTGLPRLELTQKLEEAGAAGILTSYWGQGWGVQRIFLARTQRIPTLDVSCEDYGLLFRLAESGDAPLVRVNAEAKFLGEVPVFNTIAVIPGTEKPDEYVVLSAHFDSWDGASGATDNGTGTVTMMEAMRILKRVYPRPRRTILVGHWSGEEQGLNGSGAFAADHPEVVDGLQVLLNQDNGTGRVVGITMQGFTRAEESFRRWLARVPEEIRRHVELVSPGTPGGGSDYASFVCRGAPAFSLSALEWDYSTYTWHTNRDTFDKLVFDELRNNAVLTAMLAYLASEDPQRVPRERISDPVGPERPGRREWPECEPPARSWGESRY